MCVMVEYGMFSGPIERQARWEESSPKKSNTFTANELACFLNKLHCGMR